MKKLFFDHPSCMRLSLEMKNIACEEATSSSPNVCLIHWSNYKTRLEFRGAKPVPTCTQVNRFKGPGGTLSVYTACTCIWL